ncbi:hypothetical protein DQ04_05131040 [Trypanosoma grayi]|uniref:hypothetical protein n=1 Tax=Trypanosoma grayi TaxID=71804 RepID=UPI0004F3F30F|nr:hypothetical protein DQ04_05131040 [Trypanosoma grayi]KEG09489.1 hypothetical protein DQ04_05131040 [Trypanosoma grayi]
MPATRKQHAPKVSAGKETKTATVARPATTRRPTSRGAQGSTAPHPKSEQPSEAGVAHMEDTVTLSPASSPSSPMVENCTLLQEGRSNALAVTSSPITAIDITPSSANTETVQENTANPPPAFDARRAEQTLYYLEAARVLRQVNGGVEAREQFLQNELQRQTDLHDEKRAELAGKQESYQRLQASTQRLTRQVRSLDSENDRLQDRLAQLQADMDKAFSRRALRHTQLASRQPSASNARATATRQGVTRQNIGGGSVMVVDSHVSAPFRTSSSLSSLASVRDVLVAELDAYNRKLRLAEARHDELLSELQLAVARKRGRAAAYCDSSAGSFAMGRHVGGLDGAVSFLTDDVTEVGAIEHLERMIGESLVHCD